MVWLTGASSGIGESLVAELLSAGARLAISARRREALEKIAAKGGGKVIVVPVDVTSLADVRRAHEEIVAALGPVDVLITSAGTYLPTDPTKFDAEEYGRILDLNYTGTLRCVEVVLPSMIERRKGHLVPISSLVGYRGLPRSCSYGASKAALINFFDGLRFDVHRYGIDVSVVNPGFVKTPLTDKNDFPMPFLITAEESATSIVQGILARRREIHYPAKLSWIFKFLRILPYPIYHFLILRNVVRK